ncbi:MAG: TolB family protein, partial [Vicinamibacterales bacterium]
SADGRWLAYYRVVNGERNIWVVEASGGIPAPLTATTGNNLEPAWAPDGGAVAFVSNRSGTDQLWTVPVANGRATGVPEQRTFPPFSAAAPAWSPDGSTLAFVSGDSDVWTVDAHTRRPPVRVTTGAGAWRLVWHRASAGLWVSGHWGADTLAIRRVDVRTRQLEAALPFVLQPPDADFDITADGRRIAVGRRERHGHIWSQSILHERRWLPRGPAPH